MFQMKVAGLSEIYISCHVLIRVFGTVGGFWKSA